MSTIHVIAQSRPGQPEEKNASPIRIPIGWIAKNIICHPPAPEKYNDGPAAQYK